MGPGSGRQKNRGNTTLAAAINAGRQVLDPGRRTGDDPHMRRLRLSGGEKGDQAATARITNMRSTGCG